MICLPLVFLHSGKLYSNENGNGPVTHKSADKFYTHNVSKNQNKQAGECKVLLIMEVRNKQQETFGVKGHCGDLAAVA